MEDRVGRQLGNYRLLRLLGEGGFSKVYLGEHIHLENLAAIKVLTAKLTIDEVHQFREEARTIIRLEHPNIVRVYDFGLDGDVPFIVMSYAPQGSLRQRYPQGTQQSLKSILPYVKQVAAALQYAHDQKLIHRDVKPGNMLLGSNDEVLLCDFGISVVAYDERSLITQTMTGTIHYMAPEQIQGRSRPASDQYALGICVYQWLCGIRPFEGTPVEVIVKHMTAPIPPLHERVATIPASVEAVVMRALAKAPNERFASVQAFANELEESYQSASSNSIPSSITSLILPHALSAKEPLSPSIYSETTEKEPQPNPLAYNSISDLPTISVSAGSPPDVQPAVSSLAKCPYCDAETRLGDNFCLNCGKHLSSSQQGSSAVGLPDDGWGPPLIAGPSAFLAGEEVVIREEVVVEEQIMAENEFATISDKSLPQAIPSTPPTIIPSHLELSKEQWLEKGDSHCKVRQYTDALAAYERVLQLDAEYARAHVGKGNVLLRQGQCQEAIVAYNRALDIDLENADIWSSKGEALYRSRRYEESLNAYDQALNLAPDDVGAWIAKGKTLRKLSRYEPALIAYDRALALTPNEGPVWFFKGEMLYMLGRYEEALAAYVDASRLIPTRASIWTAKGEVLYKLQRHKEALEAYNRAHILKPHDASIASKCDMLRATVERGDELAPSRVMPSPPISTPAQNKPSSEHQGASQNVTSPLQSQDEPTRRVLEGGKPPDRADVFLSYSDKDAAWVEDLAKQLEDKHDIKIWLDKWMSVPGQSRQQAKALGLDQAPCCVVCVGKQTPDAWFKQEIQLALDRQSKDKSFRVIPVLLPDASDINVDDFLELNTSVDFRNSDGEYAFYRLVCGIKGVAPGRWPPRETTMTAQTSTITIDMLQELRQFRKEQLISDALADEYGRVVLEKVWLVQWNGRKGEYK
ncbi:MAG: protein kinase [Ktedonobacteraceae bacterium]|nr:protein kinase [Ktedonobacteraceae bacterium]